MTNRPKTDRGWLHNFIDRHLLTLLLGAVIIYSNFQTADATASSSLVELKNRVDRIEAKIDKIYEQGLNR